MNNDELFKKDQDLVKKVILELLDVIEMRNLVTFLDFDIEQFTTEIHKRIREERMSSVSVSIKNNMNSEKK
jgi:hypothetical protein